MKKFLLTVSALMAAAIGTGCMPAQAEGTEAPQNSMTSLLIPLLIFAVFILLMYFMTIRPEKKREKERKNMLDSMAVGDTVLTTAGFYGVVIDITNDTVIVEFGNNKNCRIPMKRESIIQLEHPEGYEESLQADEKKEEKK